METQINLTVDFVTQQDNQIKKCGKEIVGPKPTTKKTSIKKFAISLGCGQKNKYVVDYVRRYLPLVAGRGPMTKEQITTISRDKKLMGEIVFVIEKMNRQQNQSQNKPSEEEKQQALAQQNQGYSYNGYYPIKEKI